MLKALLADSAPREQLVPVLRKVLKRKISEIARGRLRLRVPRLEGQMRAIPGMTWHLMPELFLQVSGLADFAFPADGFRLLPGEFCLVPRGVPHAEKVRAHHGPFHNFVFMFQPKFLLFHLAHEKAGRPRAWCGDSFGCAAQRLAEYLDDAVEACHSSSSCRALRVRALLLAHLTSLLTILEGERVALKDEPFKIVQARRFALTHLSDQHLSVQRIAEWTGCSADYLSFLFHKETGRTLVAFINEQRVAQAKTLLETSTLTIKETAWACGFSDPGYFTRLFRRTTGHTPQGYRVRRGDGVTV